MLCVVNLCCCFFLFFVRNFSEGFFFCSSVMCMLCVWFCRCCLAFSERALHTRFFCCWLSVSLLPMTMCYVGQNEKCGTTEKKIYREPERRRGNETRLNTHTKTGTCTLHTQQLCEVLECKCSNSIALRTFLSLSLSVTSQVHRNMCIDVYLVYCAIVCRQMPCKSITIAIR